MRDMNDVGENIVDTAMAFDLSIVNTFFEKKVNQLVTYTRLLDVWEMPPERNGKV